MRMDLTVQQLRAVVEVADAGGFTTAAQRLHLAQSSLSRTVAEVERKVGVPLFERTTRRLVPTAAGVEFTRIAREVLASFDAGLRHFTGFLAGTRGHVRVATLPSLAAILLPPVIARYRRELPDVELSIEDCLSDEVLTRVRSGAVDLAVTVVGEPPGDLEVQPLAADECCCVFPPGHRFADAETLSWQQISGEPFIAFSPGSSIRPLVDHALAEAGVVPGRTIEARNIAAVAGLAAAGLGVSAIPGLVLPLVAFAGLRHRPLDGPRAERTIALVRDPSRPRPPAVAAFTEALLRARDRGDGLPDHARWLTRRGSGPAPRAARPASGSGRRNRPAST
ncbi:LysR family transcriptional regulator [Amycolatopsis deserti]|uniref:LysR family transcriptional regulator n=1 Tax=Amycolatopsis deserti TaxID=185696 RepID=A0ABQ3IKY6_9PSEU|nr:LysR family transcriptional regulator [Amycolatopsis deserti]GHE85396.1 LysR family transcriptional regulator [Amycolatopsis deserti]